MKKEIIQLLEKKHPEFARIFVENIDKFSEKSLREIYLILTTKNESEINVILNLKNKEMDDLIEESVVLQNNLKNFSTELEECSQSNQDSNNADELLNKL